MGCCDVLMKAILIITNVVVMLAGIVMLVAGIVFFTKKFDFFPELEDYSNNVNAVLIPMIVIGVILFLVGVVGCCGAVTGKSGLLNLYFVVVLIVVILEIVVIILGIVRKADFVEATEEKAEELFNNYKSHYVVDNGDIDADVALAVNTAQFVFECCGLVDGPSWWKTNGNTQVPPGCCSEWGGEDLPASGLMTCAETTYEVGCTQKVNDMADEFGVVIIVVMVVIIVFELLCLIAACYSKKQEMVA
ncbi:tetraspanin-3-like [Bolinopsis microptera]|uniref:tetraspanin-3-like n=1 Tax=Bolinopsis microptera TaxID=2820187 RepID=UPI003078AB4F